MKKKTPDTWQHTSRGKTKTKKNVWKKISEHDNNNKKRTKRKHLKDNMFYIWWRFFSLVFRLHDDVRILPVYFWILDKMFAWATGQKTRTVVHFRLRKYIYKMFIKCGDNGLWYLFFIILRGVSSVYMKWVSETFEKIIPIKLIIQLFFDFFLSNWNKKDDL